MACTLPLSVVLLQFSVSAGELGRVTISQVIRLLQPTYVRFDDILCVFRERFESLSHDMEFICQSLLLCLIALQCPRGSDRRGECRRSGIVWKVLKSSFVLIV